MKITSEKISFKDSLTLQSGHVLSGFDLMTETYGELNSDKSNAVLVCHAFSGNHHAAGIKDGENKPGWWDEIIGDGNPITHRYLGKICTIWLARLSSNRGGSRRAMTTAKVIQRDNKKFFCINCFAISNDFIPPTRLIFPIFYAGRMMITREGMANQDSIAFV